MDTIIQALSKLSWQSFMTVSLAYAAPVVMLIVTILIIRLDSRVTCWFCNYYTSVPRSQSNSWYCPSCEQYNGFNKDGDYNKCLPAQRSHRFNSDSKFFSRKSDFTSESDILCSTCTRRQRVKIQLLNQFDTTDETNWERDYRNYQSSLEQKYSLCSSCDALAQQRVRQCDTLVLPKYVEWTKRQAQRLLFRQLSLCNWKKYWRRYLISSVSSATVYTNFVASCLFILIQHREMSKLLNQYFRFVDSLSLLYISLFASALHLLSNFILRCVNRCVLLDLILTIVYLSTNTWMRKLSPEQRLYFTLAFRISHIACAIFALSFNLPVNKFAAIRTKEVSSQPSTSATPCNTIPVTAAACPGYVDNGSDTASLYSTVSSHQRLSTTMTTNPFFTNHNNTRTYSRCPSSVAGQPSSSHFHISPPNFQYPRPGGRSHSVYEGECGRSVNGHPLDLPSPPPSRCSSPFIGVDDMDESPPASLYSRRSHVSPHQCQLLNSEFSPCLKSATTCNEEEEENLSQQSDSDSSPSLWVRLVCGVLLGIGVTCVIQLCILPAISSAKNYVINRIVKKYTN